MLGLLRVFQWRPAFGPVMLVLSWLTVPVCYCGAYMIVVLCGPPGWGGPRLTCGFVAAAAAAFLFIRAVVGAGTGRIGYALFTGCVGAALYRTALALRPSWVVLLNELGRLLVHAGQTEEGERVLRHAVELDPEYVEPRMALAALAARRAATAAQAGRRGAALRHLERALSEYERVVALDPEVDAAREAAAQVAAELSRRLGETPDAGGSGSGSERH